VPPNHPETALTRDLGLDARSTSEAIEDASAAHRTRAADVLAAVADLVSAGLNDTVEPGSTFNGLARRLEELEARLVNARGQDDSLMPRAVSGQVETGIEAAAAVETGAMEPGASAHGTAARNDVSGGPSVEAGRDHEPHGGASKIEIDAAIRQLTIRMAAIHREALRRGGSEAARERRGPSVATSAEVSQGAGAPAVDRASETSAALTTHLRRLEAKVDALVGKAAAEASSAADRHQTDLLARRIESSELQLAKRLDAGLAAAAVETRVIENMLRALAARSEAQGDLAGAVAALDRSVGAISERLDRIEAQITSLAHAPRTVDLGPNHATEHAATRSHLERETADRQVGAALDAIRDALSGIAERLQLVETHLSAAHQGFSAAFPWRRAPAAVLPWCESKLAPGGRGTETGHAEGHGSLFGHDSDKAHRAGPDPNADADILIEPRSGFAPLLEPFSPGAVRNPRLDHDEGGGGRTDFIEAARRAVRAAQVPLEPRPAEPAGGPPEIRESLGAKARRLARIVRCSIFPN
jgi:hypothetical protein